jgi:hypothetical protein
VPGLALVQIEDDFKEVKYLQQGDEVVVQGVIQKVKKVRCVDRKYWIAF